LYEIDGSKCYYYCR